MNEPHSHPNVSNVCQLEDITTDPRVTELRTAAAKLVGTCGGFAHDETVAGAHVRRVIAALDAFGEEP